MILPCILVTRQQHIFREYPLYVISAQSIEYIYRGVHINGLCSPDCIVAEDLKDPSTFRTSVPT
jgi:hypothetical protein